MESFLGNNVSIYAGAKILDSITTGDNSNKSKCFRDEKCACKCGI